MLISRLPVMDYANRNSSQEIAIVRLKHNSTFHFSPLFHVSPLQINIAGLQIDTDATFIMRHSDRETNDVSKHRSGTLVPLSTFCGETACHRRRMKAPLRGAPVASRSLFVRPENVLSNILMAAFVMPTKGACQRRR